MSCRFSLEMVMFHMFNRKKRCGSPKVISLVIWDPQLWLDRYGMISRGSSTSSTHMPPTYFGPSNCQIFSEEIPGHCISCQWGILPSFAECWRDKIQSKSCQVSILEGTSRNIMVIPSLYHVLPAKNHTAIPSSFLFLPVFTRQFLQFPCQEIDEMIRMCDSDGDGQVRSTETPKHRHRWNGERGYDRSPMAT